MPYASQIKIGTIVLEGNNTHTIKGITPSKVKGTLKFSENGILYKTSIPGKAKEQKLVVSGTLTGSNKDNDRATLETYNDGQPVRYEDGMHDGDYVIDQDSPLVFTDTSTEKTEYNYSMVLLEYSQ